MQSEKAFSAHVVALLSTVISVKLVQLAKADAPMLIIFAGTVMLINLVQSEKAKFPMFVTPDSIATDLISEHIPFHGALPTV